MRVCMYLCLCPHNCKYVYVYAQELICSVYVLCMYLRLHVFIYLCKYVQSCVKLWVPFFGQLVLVDLVYSVFNWCAAVVEGIQSQKIAGYLGKTNIKIDLHTYIYIRLKAECEEIWKWRKLHNAFKRARICTYLHLVQLYKHIHTRINL